MARNQEKANSMLNKWLASKSDDVGPGLKRRKRPYMASECKVRASQFLLILRYQEC